jgi:hypothetical protein
METLKVKQEDLKVGKRYFIKSKLTDMFMVATIIDVDSYGDILVVDQGEMIFYPKNFSFYSVPDGFYLKWNQRRTQDDTIHAIMGVGKYSNCTLELNRGFRAFSTLSTKDFSDITIPEIIEINGKKYNLADVADRIKELKEIKE